ncbi:EndoU domain-containing protein [Nitriliruptor alkaliphilus]|uniref:EndoU domain-containing protein n=1 Tax=Nitriliruptor alkaliphilus TaxID=427918 RepID=UPI00069628DC|nr:EndoU domain-containing protein [Nitriliruptor alkaliphilus]
MQHGERLAGPTLGAATRAWWIHLPRWVAMRSEGGGVIAADGHWLAAAPFLGVVLPLLAVAAGATVAIWRPGFETSFTESLPVLLALAAIGLVSSNLGVLTVASFVVGDLLLGGTPWVLDVPEGAAAQHGALADPVIAALVYGRGPSLVHWLVLALLVVAVPLVGRQLAASVTVHLRGRPTVDLGVATALTVFATAVVGGLWAAAAPQIIRPLFVFVPPWERSPTIPVDAIAPLQQQTGFIAAGLCVSVLLRAALVWAADRSARVAAIERELLRPLARTPRRTIGRDVAGAAALGVASALLVAGLVDDAWVLAVVAATMAATSLARSARLGLPTHGFRAALDRLPVLARFGVGLLVVHGIANAAIGPVESPESFQFMVWPILAGAVVLALLLPRPVPAPGEDPRPHGPLAAVGSVLLVATGVLLTTARPSLAHNCQDFSDCFSTVDAASTALLGTVVMLAISLAIDLSFVGRARGAVELVTGRDLLTGARLTMPERLAGALPFGRATRGPRAAGRSPRPPRAQPRAPHGGSTRGPGDVAGGGGTPPRRPPPPPPPPPRPLAPGTVTHLFHGHVRTTKSGVPRATGFHHRGSIGSQSRARVRRDADGTDRILQRDPGTGVYRAEVEIFDGQSWVPKKAPSTFFPDHWSRQQVLDEVRGASRNAVSHQGNLHRGVGPGGLTIEFAVGPDGSIRTAYPIFTAPG